MSRIALILVAATLSLSSASAAGGWDDLFADEDDDLFSVSGRGPDELRREGNAEIERAKRDLARAMEDEFRQWSRAAAAEFRAERQALAAEFAAAKHALKVEYDTKRVEIAAACADPSSDGCRGEMDALAAGAVESIAMLRDDAVSRLEALREDARRSVFEKRAALREALRVEVEAALDAVACQYLDLYGVRLHHRCPQDTGANAAGDDFHAGGHDGGDPACEDAGDHMLCMPPPECAGRLYATEDCTPPAYCKEVRPEVFACDKRAMEREMRDDSRERRDERSDDRRGPRDRQHDRRDDGRGLFEYRANLERWQREVLSQESRMASELPRMIEERARGLRDWQENLDHWETRAAEDALHQTARMQEEWDRRAGDLARWEADARENDAMNRARHAEDIARRHAEIERHVQEAAQNALQQREACARHAEERHDSDEREAFRKECDARIDAWEAQRAQEIQRERLKLDDEVARFSERADRDLARQLADQQRERERFEADKARAGDGGLARQLEDVARERRRLAEERERAHEDVARMIAEHGRGLDRQREDLERERARFDAERERLAAMGLRVPEPLPPLPPRASIALPALDAPAAG